MNKLLIVAAILIFLVSCTTISKEDAEKSAIGFVKNNVKFYSENKTIIDAYYQVVNFKKENENYVFDIIATTTSTEKIKSGKMSVVVDKTGNVIMVNNKPIPPQQSTLPN